MKTAQANQRPSELRLSRRAVLVAAGAVGVAATWLGGWWRGTPRSSRVLSTEEKQTLAAAQDRLLPSDVAGPGARDVYAIDYLAAALLDPAVPKNHAVFLRKGVVSLDAWARKHDAGDFVSLRPRAQDRALRDFSRTSRGRWWMRTMLGYTLEAFFGDPARGANPDELGWRWSTHRPGWPRPQARGWRPAERAS